MIRYTGLKIHLDHTEEDIKRALLKKLHKKDARLLNFAIVKKSLDARDKNFIHWNYIIDFATDKDREILKENQGRKGFSIPKNKDYRLPLPGRTPYYEAEHGRICVVGSGPAGLFAAYFLAENGFRPVLIERGQQVEERSKTVAAFWNNRQPLDPNSNIQFGEGGAGTFSDGKLNTGVNDPSGRNQIVLSAFVKFGAPKHILYDNKPHIGSDILAKIVSGMRNAILEKGGEVLFQTRFTEMDFTAQTPTQPGMLRSIRVENLQTGQLRTIPCQNLVLATGHSARDTFYYLLHNTPLAIEAKPFAVGVRIQHTQEAINTAQYGESCKEKYGDALPPADYKLVRHTDDRTPVYSFCMCPGGYVVNSSSDIGKLCVNGMSYSGRAGKNANSALVIGLEPSLDPEENIAYQEALEQAAYRAADGKIPLQRFEDFEQNRISDHFGSVIPECKGAYAFADINQILDKRSCEILKESIHAFSKRIKGFDDKDALLSAVESRTSSPIRILRDEQLESNIKGVYPCGEGAGYAGGITSAAIDGIRVFEEIYKKYCVEESDFLC